MGLRGKRYRQWSVAIVFSAWIFGLSAATWLAPSAEFSETENRVLAQMPEFTVETALNGDFEREYEEYLTDQMILRDRWMELKTSVERLLKRESNDIYFAKEGYFIEKHSGVYETQTAQRNIAILEAFARRYGAQLGEGHVSIMIVPNAVDILQEKLPPFANSGGGSDYLERIADALPAGVWFDAASVLRAHDDEALYYRTDHHWKTLAAFYVYQAWAEERGYGVPEIADYEIRTVSNCFEGTIQSKLGIRTSGDSIELFDTKEAPSYTVRRASSDQIEHSVYDDSALDGKDQYAVFFGGNDSLIQIRSEGKSGRKALVIKDSYANCFIPFMIGEFQEIDILDLRYTSDSVSERIRTGGYTDLLVLYNGSGFAEDRNASKMIH